MVSVLQVLKDFKKKNTGNKEKISTKSNKKRLQGNKRTIKDRKGLVRTEKD